MNKLAKTLIYTLITSLSSAIATASPQINLEPLIKVDGNKLVDTNNQPVVLRGFGLGGWLMPEGYMLGFKKPHDSPTGIRNAIIELTDEQTADEFFRRYERNYVTKSDIEHIAKWGFNSVRLPFNANRLMPPAKQNDARNYVYDESALQLIDNLVHWASEQKLYIILDMHAAPGGQSIHNIADSGGVARLWEEPEVYWPRTIALWQMLAKRYANNPYVIGYDVLNEPMLPGTEELGKDKQHLHDNMPLRELYIEISQAIRKEDHGNKILFLEGGFWGQNMKDLLPAWDKNTVYAYHAYPAPTSIEAFPKSVKDVMAAGHPVWFGEWGENWNALDWSQWLSFNSQITELMENNTVGWSWWTTKKFTYSTQAWQCHSPQGINIVQNYLNKRGPKPPKAMAKHVFLTMADNLATKKCYFNSALIKALGGKIK